MSILFASIIFFISLLILLVAFNPIIKRFNLPLGFSLGETFTGKKQYSSSGKEDRNFFVHEAMPPLPVNGNNPIIFMRYSF
jgi:hypothetical protein